MTTRPASEPTEGSALTSESETLVSHSEAASSQTSPPPSLARAAKSGSVLMPIVMAFIGICYIAWAVDPTYTLDRLGLYLLLAIIAAFGWNHFRRK